MYIPTIATRVLCLLSAAVVVGTSASLTKTLARDQNGCNALYPDKQCNLFGLRHSIEFGIFVGAVGLLDALLGIASEFVDAIPGLIMMTIDGFAAVVYLAAGLANAVILSKPIFAGQSSSTLTKIKADIAFMFIGFLATLAVIVLSFFGRRSGKVGR